MCPIPLPAMEILIIKKCLIDMLVEACFNSLLFSCSEWIIAYQPPIQTRLSIPVFSPAYIRHAGHTNLWHRLFFYVGTGSDWKLWCCHRPHPNHGLPHALSFAWGEHLCHIISHAPFQFITPCACTRGKVIGSVYLFVCQHKNCQIWRFRYLGGW